MGNIRGGMFVASYLKAKMIQLALHLANLASYRLNERLVGSLWL